MTAFGRELRLHAALAGSTISGATSSTSLMRAADADARGSITNIAVTMNTAKRICIAYCSDAIIAPTCIVPWSIRWLPNQMIAMLVRFSIRISAGIRNAIRRLTAIAVFVRSRFASIEPLALMRAAIERADHADAAQPFAEHQVQAVDLQPASPATAASRRA